jgi:hypothetical protein
MKKDSNILKPLSMLFMYLLLERLIRFEQQHLHKGQILFPAPIHLQETEEMT